jgi:hypothetical protein
MRLGLNLFTSTIFMSCSLYFISLCTLFYLSLFKSLN